MAISARDKIRAATLGAGQQFKRKLVTFNGVEIEVRQVPLVERSVWYNTSFEEKDGKRSVDGLKLQIYGIIASCYVPGTDEKVFEAQDYDVISLSVSDGYADQLSQAINELSGVKDVEAAKKS